MGTVITSGVTNTYTPQYDAAGQVLILALINRGHSVITLDELYHTLGAATKETQNGVRWAVRLAKKQGLISKTNLRGVYSVN